MSGGRVVTVDAGACVVTVFPLNIPSDDTTEAVITVTCLNEDGNPMAGLAAANVVPASTGTGNTITAIDSVTNQSGVITFAMTSSVAQAKTISVAICGATITDTAALTVEGSVAPDFAVEFNDYANIAAVNTDSGSNKTFAAEETGGPWSQFDRQSLETSLLGDKALRFNYPDRTAFVTPDYPDGADSLRCADFYIIRALTDFFTDNAPVTEAWVELDISFSGPLGDTGSAFTTRSPSGWSCVSNADYKWIFLTTNSTRFSWKVGYTGLYYPADSGTAIPEGPTATRFRWDPTAPGQGDGDNNFIGPNIFDGERHVVRIYAKVDAAGSTGRQKLWLDGTELYDSGGINTPTQTHINKLSLGNNLNQGPDRDCYVEYYGLKFWINGNDPGWT